MKRTKQSLRLAAKPALISIRPQYVAKILAHEKDLEFRRKWAVSEVDALVIYASSPVGRIVAIAGIRRVHQGSPSALWQVAREKSPGISRRQLYEYFRGVVTGFAVELGEILQSEPGINPTTLFGDFRPPQSFHYMPRSDYARVYAALRPST